MYIVSPCIPYKFEMNFIKFYYTVIITADMLSSVKFSKEDIFINISLAPLHLVLLHISLLNVFVLVYCYLIIINVNIMQL